MYRLPGERVALDLDGPTVTVEPIRSWAIRFEFAVLVGRYDAAADEAAQYAALTPIFGYFVAEAQPAWDIADQTGPIPATARGMVRLPLGLAFEICTGWVNTLPVELPSAVDAVVPPGPVHDEIKRRLRSVKKAA
jgi:hypothetical protein